MPIKPDDVIYNKAAIIERSLRRMKEEYSADPDLTNYTHIDAMILNIERACQAAIIWLCILYLSHTQESLKIVLRHLFYWKKINYAAIQQLNPWLP